MTTETGETNLFRDVRAVVHYGPEGTDSRHMEQSLEGTGTRPTLELFRAVTSERFEDDPFGTHRASVHVFDEVLVVHVPDGDDQGIVGTLESEARGRSLTDLCEQIRGL